MGGGNTASQCHEHPKDALWLLEELQHHFQRAQHRVGTRFEVRKTSGLVNINVLFTVINKEKKNLVDASLDKINAQIPAEVSDNL